MTPSEVVRALWNRFQEHDWTGAAELVAENAVIEWPASRERVVGRAKIIAVNKDYPEGWSIKVLKVIAEDDQVAAEVEVPHTELGLFRMSGFYLVRDGQIIHGTEYWTTVGGDEPPADRAGLVERF
ncbi:MAG: nuclear transport factor 2 family protein [Nocardiopsaceae bacterium]|jgi:ketosteroid isomerase-like protein|nr:nuclear transport factor 2 family protein [Nocardiopsaceae bacterium]